MEEQLTQLIMQNNSQVDSLRHRAICGNCNMLDSFIKIIKKLLEDKKNHHIAYRQINNFLICARPEVVNQINLKVLGEVLKVHCREDLDQYIYFWKNIMDGSNNNHPNLSQKLRGIKLSSNINEFSQSFLKSKNQFIKNQKQLQQKVQFFEDSYRNSLETRKTNSIQDIIQSYSSHSQNSDIIQKQMQQIDNIRIQVQKGPIEQLIARRHLRIIKKFLSKKPRSLKKTLSLNFNDNRIWAQQYVDNYNKYLQGGSLHIYRHFTQIDAVVIQNNNYDLKKQQRPLIINIQKGIDQQVFKQDISKGNKRQSINSMKFSNTMQNYPIRIGQQTNFSKSPIIQSFQQYNQTMNPNLYQNSNQNKKSPGQSPQQLNQQPIPQNKLINTQQNNKALQPPRMNVQSFNSQAYNYMSPSQHIPNTNTQQHSTYNHNPQQVPPQQPRMYSTVQSISMNNIQPQQFHYGQFDNINLNPSADQNTDMNNVNIQPKTHGRGLKGIKNPQYYQTQVIQSNRSQTHTYYNPKNIQNINPVHYQTFQSHTFPYNPNQSGLQPRHQLQNRPVHDPHLATDDGISPIRSLAPLINSKSQDNLFNGSRTRSRPKIFGNSRRNRPQQPQQKQLVIKKYGENGLQQSLKIDQPRNQYYMQKQPNMINSIPYNRSNYTFLSDYKSPRSSLQVQDVISITNPLWSNRNPVNSPRSSFPSPVRSDQGFYSPPKYNYNQTQIKNCTAGMIKLSEFNSQKKKRKECIANEALLPIQHYILMPYIRNFNQMTNFNRFRRNCLQNKFIVYASPELLVNCNIERITDSKIDVQLTYKNLTDSNLYVQTLYRIPKCLQVSKKSKINKKSIVEQQIMHSYSLQLVSFPLEPCLLNLKYARQQRYQHFKTAYPIIISLPISMRNFLAYLVLNEYEWKQKWDQWTTNNNYVIMRHIALDNTMIQQQHLGQGLKQYTKLNAVQGQSVRQYGAYCHQENFNNLSFLVRISQRVDNIITVYILANKRFLNQDQNDYLQYCLNVWAMLLARIEPDQVQ